MKTSHWFTLIIVALLAIMFLVEYNLPKKFVWNPTFSRNDYQPFGCAIFDDVVAGSWPKDYYISDWTFYNFANDTTGEPLAILAVAQNFRFTKTDRKAIMSLAERGNKVILAATAFSLSDTLGYDMTYTWFRPSELKKLSVSSIAVIHFIGCPILSVLTRKRSLSSIPISAMYTSQSTIHFPSRW